MIENALVYIHSATESKAFAGCGAIIEGNFIVTCRHVWQEAIGDAAPETGVCIVFPRSKRNGALAESLGKLHDPCNADEGEENDLVLLRAADPPDGLVALQIARIERFETGQGIAYARLPSRNTDKPIKGTIESEPDAFARRNFTGSNPSSHWFEKGSSGSPVFLEKGQQLAGIVSVSELGPSAQKGDLREAFIIPGTTIWRFVEAAMRREFTPVQVKIEKQLLADSANLEALQGKDARDLVFAIARRLGGDENTNFEQAVTDARSLMERAAQQIEAGQHKSNLSDLVDDLIRRLAEHTRLGDFEGGAAEADTVLAQWERMEAERRQESTAAAVRILEAGIEQDVLRGDPASAAKRILRLVTLENPDV